MELVRGFTFYAEISNDDLGAELLGDLHGSKEVLYHWTLETDEKEHWKEEGVVCQRDRMETPILIS